MPGQSQPNQEFQYSDSKNNSINEQFLQNLTGAWKNGNYIGISSLNCTVNLENYFILLRSQYGVNRHTLEIQYKHVYINRNYTVNAKQLTILN